MDEGYTSYIDKAFEILEENKCVFGRTIVLDFDDTIVKTGDVDSFMYLNTVPRILDFIRNAKAFGYFVFIITARAPQAHELTVKNAKHLGIEFDNLFTSLEYGQHPSFKCVMRDKLETLSVDHARKLTSHELFQYEGPAYPFHLKIVLTIGDQPYDIRGCSHWGILLPRPDQLHLPFDKTKIVRGKKLDLL